MQDCMTSETTDQAQDLLPPSIQKLIALIEAHKDDMNPGLARELVLQADISKEDVLPWADFGHPVRDGYGRKMVYHGGFFEIMVMSWVPGDFSSIHDHGTAQWGAVKSLGQAEHAVFELVDDRLVTRCRNLFGDGQVNAVTHDLIHQMGNVDQKPFNSLHLYGSYDHEGEITGDSRIFDLYEQKIQYTTGGVFFCLPETEISGRDEGFAADYATQQRHHVEMLKRIHLLLPQCEPEERAHFLDRARDLVGKLLAPADSARLNNGLENLRDRMGRIVDPKSWQQFWHEIHLAADLKARLQPLYG